jgi:aromatic ring-opening dioxygenase catalytic subunit (LigB family)
MAKRLTQTEINEGLLEEIYNLCYANKNDSNVARMICNRIDDTKPAKQKEAEERERLFNDHLLKAQKNNHF